MDSKIYNIDLEKINLLWDEFSSLIGKHVKGDKESGIADGKGFKIGYEIEDKQIKINIIKKPLLVPKTFIWNEIEKNMKKYDIIIEK